MPGDPDDTDDDALTWGGDDVQAPTSLPARHAAARPLPNGAASPTSGTSAPGDPTASGVYGAAHGVRPSGGDPDDRGADGGGDADDRGDGDEQLGNVALVGLGVLGGVYLLFTIGWVIGALRLQARSATFSSDPMFLGAMWLAALSPAAWFVTTWVLTRRNRAWLRYVTLVAGAVLLVPWPFLATGAVAL